MPKPEKPSKPIVNTPLSLAYKSLLPFAEAELEKDTEHRASLPKLDELFEYQAARLDKGHPYYTQHRGALKHRLYTTMRHWNALGTLLEQQSKRPLRKWSAALRCLGRLALLDLLDDTAQADYAVVDACVTLAKQLKLRAHEVGFLNANLRGFCRSYPTKGDREKALAVLPQSAWLPSHLARHLQATLPSEAMDQLVSSLSIQPPLGLRVNTSLINSDAYEAQLKGAELTCEQPDPAGLPEFYLLRDFKGNVTELPGFSEGQVYIQDWSSAWVVQHLDVKPGQTVLDTCAAPGSKTTHIAQRLQGEGQVVAVDISEARLRPLKENWERLRLPAQLLQIVMDDFITFGSKAKPDSFDRILLDAPCTALGTLKRHPELWHRLSPESFSVMAVKQLALLNAAWPLLKPGGVLVYSTCSIHQEENDEVIKRFLAEFPAATTTLSAQRWITEDYDGFFVAVLEKLDEKQPAL